MTAGFCWDVATWTAGVADALCRGCKLVCGPSSLQALQGRQAGTTLWRSSRSRCRDIQLAEVITVDGLALRPLASRVSWTAELAVLMAG